MAPLFVYCEVTSYFWEGFDQERELLYWQRTHTFFRFVQEIKHYYALHADMQKIQNNELVLLQNEKLYTNF